MNIETTFNERRDNPLYNTSYPINPSDWTQYRVHRPLSFEGEQEISFYIHIPFCKKLCSFCEYTRMISPKEQEQYRYLCTLKNDIVSFVSNHQKTKLRGFDIGGGTPTALSDDNFHLLLSIFRDAINWLAISEDFEPSIEGTFDTITKKKAKMIVEVGIQRVSLGVQSTCSDVLLKNHRDCQNLIVMKEKMAMLHKEGVKKINLDMMYGLKGQTRESIEHDIITLKELNPEQVTLYELRTNMIKEETHISKQELFDMYTYLYNSLCQLGYHARFGQNTFSKDDKDMGVSSYLRSRMLDGVSYKGFGISAQSMSHEGVSYNVGKLSSHLKEILSQDTFQEEYTYVLPAREIASKYIAIGAYNGSFSLLRLSEIINCNAQQKYASEIEFCLKNELMRIENGRMYITNNGFMDYGAVFSLFYAAIDL